MSNLQEMSSQFEKKSEFWVYNYNYIEIYNCEIYISE